MTKTSQNDERRRIRKIHKHEQMLEEALKQPGVKEVMEVYHATEQAGATRYVDAGQLYRSQADEFRRMGNPAGAAHLDDMAADCDVVADDIMAGRRRP